MKFRDWQQLSPAAAAHELHRRVRASLSRTQQRAVLALLKSEPQLTNAFAASDRSAPLGGVPYFLKDLFDIAGQPTFAGSSFLPEARPLPTANSTVVTTLRTAGAVLAGKTQLHEFAYGITGENPHYGDCEHPRFPTLTTGGSSSGSAAVVAAGITPFAIGTDTGGSIRVPAAFCRLHGFRLTPRDPLIADAIPLAPSFDTVGWFTADAADMRAAIDALVGTSPGASVLRGCYLEPPELDREVVTACREASARFAAPADHATRAMLLNGFSPALETYSRIVAAEAWAFHRAWFDQYHSRYDPAVLQRLEQGRSLAPTQLARARADATALQSLWSAFFDRFDFLVMPATPFGALTKDACTAENRRRLLALTTPASVGGLPVLTLPVKLASGLSSGLQIIAKEPKSPVFAWALGR